MSAPQARRTLVNEQGRLDQSIAETADLIRNARKLRSHWKVLMEVSEFDGNNLKGWYSNQAY